MRMKAVLVGLAVIAAACSPSESTATATSVTSLPPTSTTTEPALQTGVGVEDGTIKLAAFLPLSGSLAGIGKSILEGHRAYWRYVNEDLGGVSGEFTVALDAVDTAYDPDTAVAELEARGDLLLGISSVLGSPVTSALLDADTDLPIAVGSQATRWAEHLNAVFDLAVPTYRDQVSALFARAAESAGDLSDVGFVAPAGVYGDDCLAGAPTEPGIVSRYPPGTTDFEEIVKGMEGTSAVIACVTSADLSRIIATSDLLDIVRPIFATAASYDAAVPDVLGTIPTELLVAGAPPPLESDAVGMQLFRDTMARAGVEVIDQWTLLGYTQAATFHLLLEQAIDDGTLTREGVLAARGSLGDVDFGFGWGPARFDGILPEVPVTVSVPDPDAAFGLRPLES